MIQYRTITDISLVTDTISIYQENRYLNCRYDTDTDISISATYQRYFRHIDPPLLLTLSDCGRYLYPGRISPRREHSVHSLAKLTCCLNSLVFFICNLFFFLFSYVHPEYDFQLQNHILRNWAIIHLLKPSCYNLYIRKNRSGIFSMTKSCTSALSTIDVDKYSGNAWN